MSNPLLYLSAFLAYGALAVYFWRTQATGNGEVLNRGVIGHLVLLPLALHAYLLYGSLFSGGQLNLGLVLALVLPVSCSSHRPCARRATLAARSCSSL